MKSLVFATLLAIGLPPSLLQAELPPEIRHHVEEYERGMAAYELNITTMMKNDRDTYLALLKRARRFEVSGKRNPTNGDK